MGNQSGKHRPSVEEQLELLINDGDGDSDGDCEEDGVGENDI